MTTDAIVIVGAGHAGGRVAETLRGTGVAVPIHLIGEEAYPPYERPPLSKELLIGKKTIEQTFIQPATYWAEHGIDLRLGVRAVGLDRAAQRVSLSDGTALDYATLVFATGGRPRRLSLPGADGPRVRYLRDIEDTRALQAALKPGARVVVVGAGVIGLEVAASAQTLGCAVTVLEVAPAPLGRVVERSVGDWFLALHRARGVDMRMGAGLQAIEDGPAGAVLTLADGTRLDADVVVVGIGIIPNAELARAAGLDVDDGIVVDDCGRTTDPAIFAVGDVARGFHAVVGRHVRLEAWRNADNAPRAVAQVIAGGSQPYVEVPWMWSDQYDVNLQVAGLPRAVDQTIRRGGDDKFTLLQLHGGVVVGGVTVNQGRDMRPIQQLIAKAAPVDPARLADPAVQLGVIAKGA
ncbi:MAG: FAD-dependent oxidoreductase [Alphaproteobacteria bacterium]|nr:FAD-dependent oxidoreductase [Alphaproteobacteria bacterium]